MGVGVKDIKCWFTEESQVQEHAGDSPTTPREKPPTVQVRARLPITSKWAHPPAPYIPERGVKYMEEDHPLKTDVNPLWKNAESSRTVYAYDPEDQELTDVANMDGSSFYDNGDAESQDSGFEHASVTEVGVKEHVMDPSGETKLATRPKGEPTKISARDPRRRRVSLASPATIFRRTAAPMADP